MSYSPDMSATHEYSPHQYRLLSPLEVATLDGKVQAYRALVQSINRLPAGQQRSVAVRHILDVIEQEASQVSELLGNHISTPQVSDETNLFA